MSLFGRVIAAVKSLISSTHQTEKQTARYTREMLRHDSRQDGFVFLPRLRRRLTFKHSSYYRGAPVLTGSRLRRVSKQCHSAFLTVLTPSRVVVCERILRAVEARNAGN